MAPRQDGESGEVREWKAALAASTVRSMAGMEKWVIQSEVVWNRARPEVTRIITENKAQKQKARQSEPCLGGNREQSDYDT
ncbi:unnamed protein product [Boreogadus saida]